MSDEIKKGLLGIIVDETEVSKVMPEINLTYRGYAAQDLCEYCRFENGLSYLNKDLPNTIELRKLRKKKNTENYQKLVIDN